MRLSIELYFFDFLTTNRLEFKSVLKYLNASIVAGREILFIPVY
jgi:hypothetical protein